jgi:hypothetical protein
MQVNEYMKLICVKNLTVMGLQVTVTGGFSIPGYFYQHM